MQVASGRKKTKGQKEGAYVHCIHFQYNLMLFWSVLPLPELIRTPPHFGLWALIGGISILCQVLHGRKAHLISFLLLSTFSPPCHGVGKPHRKAPYTGTQKWLEARLRARNSPGFQDVTGAQKGLGSSEGPQSPGYPALDQAPQPGFSPLIIHPCLFPLLWLRPGNAKPFPPFRTRVCEPYLLILPDGPALQDKLGPPSSNSLPLPGCTLPDQCV